MWYVEVVLDFFMDFVVFLVVDDYYWGIVEVGNVIDDCWVVGEMLVVVQFFEIVEQVVDVVEGIGMFGMVCELGDLLIGQIVEDVFGECFVFVLQM